MDERNLDYREFTLRIARKIPDDSYPLRHLMDEEGCSRVDAIGHIVAETSLSFPTNLKKKGQVAQALTVWGSVVRGIATERYHELRAEMEEADKAQINAVPDLEMLNGIRRGIRRAMKRYNRYSELKM